MNRNSGKRRVVAVAALLAPVLVVQSFRALSGWQVDTTAASVVKAVEQPAPAPVEGAGLSPEARRAREWLASRGPVMIDRSPMDHVPGTKPSAQPAPTETPDGDQTEARGLPTTRLSLTGIMGGGATNVASINGKIYRLGEDVEPGWTIIAIQPRRMVVVLSGPDGQVVELSRAGLEPR